VTDFSAISQLQNAFDQAIGGGFANIQSDVNWLFASITILSLTLTAIFAWAWGEADTILRSLLQRILLIGFVGYLVSNWHSLTMIVVDGMTQLGLKAGGSSETFNTFLTEPEQIAVQGYNLAKHVSDVCKSCGLITEPAWFCIYMAAMALILLAMFWLAIQVFVTTLEFKLVTLASLVFVPFAVWQKTTFLSDRALGYAFSVGAKLLTLALVVTIGSRFLNNLTVSATPNLENAAVIVLACFTVLILALSAGSLASALVSGGPQLGAGAFVGAAAATAAMGGAAYLGGRTAIGGAISGSRGAINRYAAASRSFAQAGENGGSTLRQIGAGLKGAAFPSSAPPSAKGASAPPPGPNSGGSSGAAPSQPGATINKVAQATHAAVRAGEGRGGSFGPTGMNDDAQG
jgi:type IV secretion system protein TrbL